MRQVVARPDTTWFGAKYTFFSEDAPEVPRREDASEFRLLTDAVGFGSVVLDPPSENGYCAAGT